MYGDGQNIRDWLFVEDHVKALMLLSQNGDVGENYCIGGNCEKTNQRIVSLICNFLDKKIPKNKSYLDQITYVKDRPGHDRRYFINTKKINIELRLGK